MWETCLWVSLDVFIMTVGVMLDARGAVSFCVFWAAYNVPQAVDKNKNRAGSLRPKHIAPFSAVHRLHFFEKSLGCFDDFVVSTGQPRITLGLALVLQHFDPICQHVLQNGELAV